MDDVTKRQGWFLPLRLATYVILLAVVVFWMKFPAPLQREFILYSFFTLGLTVAIALERKVELKAVIRTIVILQFLFEIAIDSMVIYTTGNVNSPFSALYLLSIVSAALVFRLAGTLLMASLVSMAYAFIIWIGFSISGDYEITLQTLRTIFSSQDSLFYSIFIHILIFYLVAFISGYLAERLSSQDRQLADASQALRRARLETDDILRHLNSGLLTIDAQGNIIYFNQAAERILGYREENVRGMPCQEVFAERMPHLAETLLEGLEHGREHPRKEIDILNGDKNRIPLGVSTSILTEDGQVLRGVIAIFSDLTEAKILESKVRAADRLAAIGELSASIAHEIRNPLAAISGSVEVLNQELVLEGENARLMELIIKESHRLSTILNDFLAYARIGRPAYNKVELYHLVGDTIKLLHHHRAFRPDIEISLESDESLLYVIGDENLIKQLLMNLAINACEAFEDSPGEIIFRAAVDPARGVVELYIQDNGPGIPEAMLEKIFTPFYSSKKQGTGLGLAIVQRICSMLNFTLSVDSQVGYGTTFMIEFKAFQPASFKSSDKSVQAVSA